MQEQRTDRTELETVTTQAKHEQFVRYMLEYGDKARAYMETYPGEVRSRQAANKRADVLLTLPDVRAYHAALLEKLEIDGIASLERTLSFLTRVVDNEEKDQFGLDLSISDRIKAAEMLIRHHGGFKDKIEIEHNVSFAAALKDARERVLSNTNKSLNAGSTDSVIDAEVVN